MPLPAERLPPAPREKCAVLVPAPGAIGPRCGTALDELERRGYAVRRVRGDSQTGLDRGRIAQSALDDGFEETFWIEPEIIFHPDDVDHLRAHGLPLVGAIYATSEGRALACRMVPGTREVVLGPGGGLLEILYAASGFLCVRREVYQDVARRFAPPCEAPAASAIAPYFEPLMEPGRRAYLNEGFSFCERARQCGYKVWADTGIRPRQAGGDDTRWPKPRIDIVPLSVVEQERLSGLMAAHPWPGERPAVAPNPHGWLRGSTQELLASVLNDRCELVLELGSWLGKSTRFIADSAPRAVVLAVDHWQGSSEHHIDPACRLLLPTLYETFLANCWEYRERIVPMRVTTAQGIDEIARRGLRDHRWRRLGLGRRPPCRNRRRARAWRYDRRPRRRLALDWIR